MRHTVIGVFDTYAQAEGARSALISAGFPRNDIELQANPKRDDAAEPTIAPDVETHREPGMLANIERFFSMLFGGRDQPPEVAHYSEAVRRGAVLVAVDTPSIEQADIARTTLSDQGAIDIDERAASWNAFEHGTTASASPTDDRDHSVLDELGLGRGSAVPGREPVNDPNMSAMTPSRARAYPRADIGDPAVEPVLDPLEDPLGDPLAKRDPVSLSSRDYITDPADDPLMPRAGARGTNESEREHAARDPLAGRDPVTGRDPLATTGADSLEPRDPLTGMPTDPLSTRSELSGESLSERDALAGRDALLPEGVASTQAMGEREARQRQEEGTLDPLPGVRTDTAADWRPVNEPLGPLDEAAKPYQSTSGMQSQAPGMQAQSIGAPGSAQAPGPVGPAATGPAPTGPGAVPNEYMEYEEDFRADYDARYAATGEPYEDYQGAYRFGAMLGNDDRFRSRAWDEQMEYETRRDWESRNTDGADTWERFKAAIRHGWDRVTGHHHV